MLQQTSTGSRVSQRSNMKHAHARVCRLPFEVYWDKDLSYRQVTKERRLYIKPAKSYSVHSHKTDAEYFFVDTYYDANGKVVEEKIGEIKKPRVVQRRSYKKGKLGFK